MKILNPELKIIPVQVGDRKFNIVRDDFLVGGTKQRMLGEIMIKNKAKEFVYAGPIYGYAQIAVSYVANLLGKKATLFLETKRPRFHLTKFAEKFNPKIIEVGEHAKLKYVQEKAEQYADKSDDIYLIPFGLYSKKFIEILAEQIKKALPDELRDPMNYPKRIWLVAGSGTILNALYLVFRRTHFCIVQVGKKIWPDQIDESRTTLYISDQPFWEVAKIQPPYPTVSTYDAKLWKFVLEYGEDEDYVWNVAKDV